MASNLQISAAENPTPASNKQYDASLKQLISTLDNIQSQNKTLKGEVNSYSKDHPKNKTTIIAPPPKPIMPTAPLTPMDREAMSSAIFFPGGFPQPEPVKQAQVSQPTTNQGENPPPQNPDEMMPPPGEFDNNDMNNMDSDSSESNYSNNGFSGGGGGQNYPYSNSTLITLSFNVADTSKAAYTYKQPAAGSTPFFTFPDNNLFLSQTAIQTLNLTSINLTQLRICNNLYESTSCTTPPISTSNNLITVGNSILSANNTLYGSTSYQIKSTDSKSYVYFTPELYVESLDSNGISYNYSFQFTSVNSGSLICSPENPTTGETVTCRQSSSPLTQNITLL